MPPGNSRVPREPLARFLLALAVAFSIALPIAAAAPPAPPGRALVRYEGGGLYSGHFQGSCDAKLVRPGELPSSGLVIEHEGGRLVLLTTDAVLAHHPLADGAPLPQGRGTRQVREEVALEPGEARVVPLDGDPLALVLLHGIPFDPAYPMREPFAAEFTTTRLHTYPVQPGLESTETFWHRQTGGPATPGFDSSLPLPVTHSPHYASQRLVHIVTPSLDLAGDFALYLRDVRVEPGAGQRDERVGPYQTVHGEAPLEGAGAASATFREAFLLLEDAHARLAAPPQALHCGKLAGRLEGRWVAEGASGSLQAGGLTVGLSGERVTIDGRFTVQETPRLQTPPKPSHVEADAAGEFDALALDHAPVPLGPHLAQGAGAASLLATVAAALVLAYWRGHHLLALLYTRLLQPDVLSHPRRALLVSIARESPGLSLTEMGQRSNLRLGVLRHHLGVLRAAGFVEFVRNGRALRVIAPTGDRAAARVRALVQRDARFAHLVESLHAGTATQGRLEGALAARFGITRRGARKIIASAERAGIVQRDRGPQGVTVRCAQPL